MKKNKIRAIIKHDYLMKVKSKGFIISTILAPLMIFLFFGVIALVTYLSVSSEPSAEGAIIAVKDATGQLADRIVKYNDQKKEQFVVVTSSQKDIEKEVLEGKYIAALVFNADAIAHNNARVIVSESTGLNFVEHLRYIVNNEIKDIRLKSANIDEQTIELIHSSVDFQTTKVTSTGVVEDNSEFSSVISYILGFIMYGLMFMYGTQVMQGVIEEKSNRIVEVLASSATPFEIMFGKVVGIGLVGLTQIVIWCVLGGIILFFTGTLFTSNSSALSQLGSMQEMMNTSPEMMEVMKNVNLSMFPFMNVLGFIFYFISGYFIYATLFAAAASTVEQMQDSNTMATPITLFIIVPILCIQYVVLNPESIASILLSLFPFFAPILMVGRMNAISVPAWQLLVSVVLQIGTFLLCLKIAGKIYRAGMLRYGKKPSFKEIILWVRGK